MTAYKTVTFQGNPLPVSGTELKIGDAAPDFTVLTNEMQPFGLKDAGGDIQVFVSVPSLDTPVCDMEARRFNAEAAKLGGNVKIYVISADLPFAQSRWCGAAGVDHVKTLSDHKGMSFAQAYGVYLEPLRLLSRAIFIVKGGVVKYIQFVPEITDEPDYDDVLGAVSKL